jgi:superfamily II DNA helicase RecQ
MPFEFIQVPANGQGGGKDALNRFLRGGRIASIRKEFVANGEDSFWAFCVEYVDGAGVPPSGAEKPRLAPKVDYREILSDSDFTMFVRLRNLRKEIAEKDAVPSYSIFNNEQLAAMVTGKVDSLASMQTIAGVGEARVSKYGEAFLNELTGKSVTGV